ncbi:hypothetical protein HYH03_004399 [Edaphochlamys debaryana]|uniref:Methyltransferase FkbM domain-containing protein n=1 Tax=Edaphochlamys debaryana TaxID=47281 RepID=A0A835YF69_9CHLO|nr:hypothetical protein HYH03_004399 [Edaphochlamys debaryana]|eukprot:KAG2497660.1 hypothetical protein HYH03_004399 [Edaphochlamys debaryana]
MEQGGMVEPTISKIFYRVLKDRCLRPDGSRALVVDVGANFGWFAILAARLGCRVIAYEPVPHFRWFLEYNVHINGLSHRVDVRAAAVSNQTSQALRMVVPSTGIWGTAGLGGLNIDHAIEGKKEEIQVPSVRLEDEVKEDVLLMKVDVEGWEYAVIQGAEGLLSKYNNNNVENIVMEYSPGVPERHMMVEEEMETVRMLARFMHRGYRIGHIGSGSDDLGSWGEPVQPMREVTLDNLKYDMTDLRMWKNRTLGCPPREELAQYAVWTSCNQIPEDLSPRSFRATFQHNTNVWVARGASLEDHLQLSGAVGVVDLQAPPSRWMSTTGQNTGLGCAWCDMDPVWQVRSRCPCTQPAVCGPEQETVERLAAQGLLASNYVLTETAAAVLGLAEEPRGVA